MGVSPQNEKAMKQIFRKLNLAALVIVGAMAVGCTGALEEINPNTPQETTPGTPEETQQQPESKTVTLTTTISLGTETKALDAEGVKTFAVGDQIAVVYEDEAGLTQKAVSIALTAENIHEEGKKADITVSLTDPKADGVLRYIYPAAMALETIATDATIDDAGTVDFTRLDAQDGMLATLASNYDLAVYDGNLTGTELPASATLENQLAIGEFTIKDADGTIDLTSTLTGVWISDGTNNYAVSRSASEGPIYVAMRPVASSATITFAAQTASAYYEREVTGKTLAAGNMYPVGVRMTRTHTVNLARLCNAYEAQNGETLTGKLALCNKITIAAGASVTLNNVDINGDNTFDGKFPGIKCNGNATLTLVGTNTVRGCYGNGYPGIFPANGKTLTINGTGKLFAYGNGQGAAGIGGGKSTYLNCGNIRIESGEITAIATSSFGAGIGSSGIAGFNNSCDNITITGGTVIATGGKYAAGIGTGCADFGSSKVSIKNQCGNITITGGTVIATGGVEAAGIGLGYTTKGGTSDTSIMTNQCGTITITDGVTRVTAIRGDSGTYCIGKGAYQSLIHSTLTCGTITIGGEGKGTDGVNPDPDGNTYVYQP